MENFFENVPYNHSNFPIYIQREEVSSSKPYVSHVNWHNDIEFVKILSGSINCCVNGEIIKLYEGNGIFVNSNQIHYNFSDGGEACNFICIVLDPSFLYAKKHFEEKYILPIITDQSLAYYVLKTDVEWENRVLENLEKIYDIQSESYFELKLHPIFFSIWENIYKNLYNEKTESFKNMESALSFKKMVSYIHLNYKRKITLEDIAEAGNVCKTTCNKIFKIYTGCSPIEYLTEYRLRKAIDLIEDSKLNMTQICYECGFCSSSYFAETFKKIFGCSPSEYKKTSHFEIQGGNEGATITIKNQREKDGIIYLTVKFSLQNEEVPEPFSVTWKQPFIDCYSTWSPSIRHERNIAPNWAPNTTESRLAMYMPLHSIVSIKGKNRITISLSDVLNPTSISTGVCEEDASIDCKVTFFTIPVAPLKEYSAIIRIDKRDIAYYDSVYDNTEWWENECGYKAAYVPEYARLPMNSLWYSYHQNLDVEDIIKECKLSKELGMHTVIVDDGWQTDDNSRGYAYCGDWEVSSKKIPDIKKFIDDIHSTGMKVIFWFSVPYVGIYSKNYQRFKDMLLDNTGDNKTYLALDPRYKEVREFLLQTFTTAVKEWKLDGLKLDFIDVFLLRGKSLEYDERRDYQALEDAIDVLVSDITKELKKINPEILIEFRQPYNGPGIRKYGNILRVIDCPNDAQMNRKDIINLRLTSGDTAVHSDMLMWNRDDGVETAALQIASAMYSVPQISVKIASLPESHKKMLSFYLSLWKENRDILLGGKVIASEPESGYSIAAAVKGNDAFYTCFTENVIANEYNGKITVINASSKKSIIFKNLSGKKYTVCDCMGNNLSKGTIVGTLCEVEVPLSGVIFID